MATKKSGVMNPAPGPKPGPRGPGKHHPATSAPAGMGNHLWPDASAGKGGGTDPMRTTKQGQGPTAMLSPVKPGKNEMNINPR